MSEVRGVGHGDACGSGGAAWHEVVRWKPRRMKEGGSDGVIGRREGRRVPKGPFNEVLE